MKRYLKSVALVMMFMFAFTTFFTACGGGKDDVTTSAGEGSTVTGDSTAVNSTASNEGTSQAVASVERKKIVIVNETLDDIHKPEEQNILSTLEKNGYIKDKTAEITEINMEGNSEKDSKIVERIKEMKPDVVIIQNNTTAQKVIGEPLIGSNIPVVISSSLDTMTVIDENGMPKSNITGLRTTPTTILRNSFDYLNQISPINGKKAVFITIPFGGFISKENVKKNLKEMGIELKEYVIVNNFEEWQAAVKKYNKDDEVGWMLVGLWPNTKKDGSKWSTADTAKWDIANREKPSVTYWEVAVQMGILCGLGVDIPATGTQAAEMAVKVLKGEKVGNIKIEDPIRYTMVLNQKRAEDLGIKFPTSIMGSASRVYKDYEGNYIK